MAVCPSIHDLLFCGSHLASGNIINDDALMMDGGALLGPDQAEHLEAFFT